MARTSKSVRPGLRPAAVVGGIALLVGMILTPVSTAAATTSRCPDGWTSSSVSRDGSLVRCAADGMTPYLINLGPWVWTYSMAPPMPPMPFVVSETALDPATPGDAEIGDPARAAIAIAYPDVAVLLPGETRPDRGFRVQPDGLLTAFYGVMDGVRDRLRQGAEPSAIGSRPVTAAVRTCSVGVFARYNVWLTDGGAYPALHEFWNAAIAAPDCATLFRVARATLSDQRVTLPTATRASLESLGLADEARPLSGWFAVSRARSQGTALAVPWARPRYDWTTRASR